MADNNPYSVIGAGKDNKNPIEVSIDCGESAATVCWVGRLSMPVGCVDGYRDEKICSAITINQSVTESSLKWNGNDVFYKVTSGECPTPPSTSCTSACTDLDVYPVPLTVQSGYNGNIDVHYSYYVTCEKNDYVGSRVKKSGSKSVPIRNFTCSNGECKYTYKPDGLTCSSAITVYLTSSGGCTSGESVDVSFLFNPSYVPAEPSSGTDVTVSVLFKRVSVDEECNKKVVNGQFPLKWHVKCTKGTSDDKSSPDYKYRCCSDHYVESSITKSDIITKSGAKQSAKVYYNGSEIPDGGSITYSILQRGKTTEECSGLCQEKTTYCVDKNSVNVEYEVGGYMSDIWSGSGCSIVSPSQINCNDKPLFEARSGVGEGLEVPSTGGRIKVTWKYSAHTITNNCYEYDSSGGTWEEIITIGGCDERPTDCKNEYNEIEDREGHKTAYDNATYNGCNICDSECCYNYDGQGNCRCVILFKEQTPGCTTCDYSDVWDGEEKRVIRYNKIRYQFKQSCTLTCQDATIYTYEKQTKVVPKCSTDPVTLNVPFTAVTEHVGTGCPEPTTTTGTKQVVVEIPDVNNTDKERVIRDDDMVYVAQSKDPEGPCSVVTYCTCEDLDITNGYVHTLSNNKANQTTSITYTVSELCDSTVVTAETDSDWLVVESVTPCSQQPCYTGTIVVKTTKSNCGVERSAFVIPYYSNRPCNDKPITIKQPGTNEQIIKVDGEVDAINCGDTPRFKIVQIN